MARIDDNQSAIPRLGTSDEFFFMTLLFLSFDRHFGDHHVRNRGLSWPVSSVTIPAERAEQGMEYRGYDSVGLALSTAGGEQLTIHRAAGRLAALLGAAR